MVERAIEFPQQSPPWTPPTSSWTHPSPPAGCPALIQGVLDCDFSFHLHFVQRFFTFWPFISLVASSRHPPLPEERRLLGVSQCAPLFACCQLQVRLQVGWRRAVTRA